MNLPHVRAVLFDYGGVLRRDDAQEFDAFAAGYDLPPGWLRTAFYGVPEHALLHVGAARLSDYRRAVVRVLSHWIGPDRAEECFDGWVSTLAAASPLEPEMADLVSRLAGTVRLGILSNAGRGALEALRGAGVARRFDDVVCSGDVGLSKPDPAVFRLAAARLGVDPAACAFVDDLVENVEGARATGMAAHLYRRSRHADLLAFLADVGALAAEAVPV